MSKALITMQARVVDAVQGRKERGATMVEYALLVAFIALVAVTGVSTLGGGIKDFFDAIASSLGGVATTLP